MQTHHFNHLYQVNPGEPAGRVLHSQYPLILVVSILRSQATSPSSRLTRLHISRQMSLLFSLHCFDDTVDWVTRRPSRL